MWTNEFKMMYKHRTELGLNWRFLGTKTCDFPVKSFFETFPAPKPIVMVNVDPTRLAAPGGFSRCPSTPLRPSTPDEDRKARKLRLLQRELAWMPGDNNSDYLFSDIPLFLSKGVGSCSYLKTI